MMRLRLVTALGDFEADAVGGASNMAIHAVGLRWAVSQVSSGLQIATFPHRRHAWDFIRAAAVAVPAVVHGEPLTGRDRSEIRRLVAAHNGRMPGEEG